jgi:tetratricopeptide (TPR) repeat protein
MSTKLPICGKTPSRCYPFQSSGSKLTHNTSHQDDKHRDYKCRYWRTLWEVSSVVSILGAQFLLSMVPVASARVIAPQSPTLTTSHTAQLSSIPSSSKQSGDKPRGERIGVSGRSASALNNRGLERMNHGDYAAAQTLFNQAIQSNPRFAPAYNNRAMIHILMGEEAIAVQDYSISLSLNPTDSDVYFNRGLAYATLDNNSAAIADYTRALQLNPRNAQAYHARGGVYLSLNNRPMARADFQNAVVLYQQQGYQEEYRGLQEFLKLF